MGILDESKQKTKRVAKAAGDKIKDVLIESIESIPADYMADFVEVAAEQRSAVNALLEQRGVSARIGHVVVRMGPPPTVDLIITEG